MYEETIGTGISTGAGETEATDSSLPNNRCNGRYSAFAGLYRSTSSFISIWNLLNAKTPQQNIVKKERGNSADVIVIRQFRPGGFPAPKTFA